MSLQQAEPIHFPSEKVVARVGTGHIGWTCSPAVGTWACLPSGRAAPCFSFVAVCGQRVHRHQHLLTSPATGISATLTDEAMGCTGSAVITLRSFRLPQRARLEPRDVTRFAARAFSTSLRHWLSVVESLTAMRFTFVGRLTICSTT